MLKIMAHRVNKIVKMAGNGENKHINSWILQDERQIWRKEITRILQDEKVAQQAEKLGMSEAELDGEIAVNIRIQALDALRRDLKNLED